ALMNLTPVVALSLLCAAGPFAHPKFNKRNPMFGFRTAFTISNEEAWNKINAFASITLTAATLIGYVLILVFIEYEWAMLFILVLLLMMVPSFIYHEILRHKAQK
nr:SdpI family protein [Bacilli bacterium]